MNVYSDFINSINDRFGLDILKEEAAAILNQGLWVDGEKVSLKYTRTIFEKYFVRLLQTWIFLSLRYYCYNIY